MPPMSGHFIVYLALLRHRLPAGAGVGGLVERAVEADDVGDVRPARCPGDRTGAVSDVERLVPRAPAVGRAEDTGAGGEDELRLLRVDREAHQLRAKRLRPGLAVAADQQALLH